MRSRAVCIKAKNLREMGYTDLEQWMAYPDNVYTGRQGRIFITDGETKQKRYFSYPGSKWHNPYKLKDYPLEKSLQLYIIHLFTSGLILQIDELRGKNLGCFCTHQHNESGSPICHAQVLADLLNRCEYVIRPYIDSHRSED